MKKRNQLDFSKVKVDEDTQIVNSAIWDVQKYQAFHQLWTWNGYIGQSLIFCTDDIKTLSDEELKKLALEFCIDKKQESITLSRKPDYSFVNFNFKKLDD